MKLPAEDINCPVLLEKYSEYFDFAESFWKTAFPLLSDKAVIGIGNNTNFNTCVCGAFAKQMRLYYGIIKLCRSGLSHESSVLLRTMFYTSTYLLALSESDDKRKFAKLWLAWNFAIDDRNYKGLPRIKNPRNVSLLNDELDKSLEEFKKTLPDGKWKDFIAHGSDLLFYAQPEDNGITCQLSPSDEVIDNIILTAAIFLRDACVQTNDLLNLGRNDIKNKVIDLFETHKDLKVMPI